MRLMRGTAMRGAKQQLELRIRELTERLARTEADCERLRKIFDEGRYERMIGAVRWDELVDAGRALMDHGCYIYRPLYEIPYGDLRFCLESAGKGTEMGKRITRYTSALWEAAILVLTAGKRDG